MSDERRDRLTALGGLESVFDRFGIPICGPALGQVFHLASKSARAVGADRATLEAPRPWLWAKVLLPDAK